MRELQVEARKRATYWSRFFWGLAAIAALGIVVFNTSRGQQTGEYLFNAIHGSLAVMLLFIAPLTAADAISRERREGTLGLLFLTPLTARQIVLSKLTTRLFRVLYLWLMFVPFLILPLLMGGVSLEQALISIAILLCILIAGISAAFIGSAISIHFSAAIMRGLFFATLATFIILAFAVNLPTLLFDQTGNMDVPWSIRIAMLPPYFLFLPSLILEAFKRAFPTGYFVWPVAGALLLSPLILLTFSLWFCTRRIIHYSESSIETARQAALRRRFLTPVLWKNRFRKSMQRKLDKNPFVWLEYRAAWARAGRTSLVLGLIALETLIATQNPGLRGFFEAQTFLLWMVVLMITLKSTTGFQYEKESGALELILVTPITVWKLVAGRLAAVHRYFMPVVITLALGTAFVIWFDSRSLGDFARRPTVSGLNLWLSMFSVPAVGLFFALRCKNYIHGLILTTGVAIFAAPLAWGLWNNLVWFLANRLRWSFGNTLQALTEFATPWAALIIFPLYHLALIIFTRRHAVRALERRTFARA